MARNHARILTSIWTDPDFVALCPQAQHVYLLLVSQPDLSPCGVLPFLPRRWARLSANGDEAMVLAAVGALEAARFVVIDRDTEELAIRTFVVHDGGLNNPKMRGAVRSSLRAIHSPALRSAVLAVVPSEYKDEIANGIAVGTSIEPQSDCDEDAVGSRMRSNAEVGGRGRRKDSREPWDAEFTAWWDKYPRKVSKQAALKAFTARRREGVALDDLTRARDTYASSRVGEDQKFTLHASTFLGRDGPWVEWLAGNPDGVRPDPDEWADRLARGEA